MEKNIVLTSDFQNSFQDSKIILLKNMSQIPDYVDVFLIIRLRLNIFVGNIAELGLYIQRNITLKETCVNLSPY